MYWNYRVIQLEHKNSIYYEVCEVYYDENNIPNGFAESHNLLIEDELNELKDSYKEIAKAFEKPILKFVDGKLVQLNDC